MAQLIFFLFLKKLKFFFCFCFIKFMNLLFFLEGEEVEVCEMYPTKIFELFDNKKFCEANLFPILFSIFLNCKNHFFSPKLHNFLEIFYFFLSLQLFLVFYTVFPLWKTINVVWFLWKAENKPKKKGEGW